jgi:hypothetical protein
MVGQRSPRGGQVREQERIVLFDDLIHHCERCDAKLGDFETIDEFDAPLRPLHPERESCLRLYSVLHPLEAQAASVPWHGSLVSAIGATSP